MTMKALTRPRAVRVNRAELRQKQRETLNRAKDSTVVVISAANRKDEKMVLDKKYFDELVQRLRSAAETLDIMTDRKLFAQILRAGASLEKKARSGKLHSFEEAFGEK